VPTDLCHRHQLRLVFGYSQEWILKAFPYRHSRRHRNRKEGHLYFVTEDRNNEIYLWDFTDKPKHEFKEVIASEDLLNVAKEGAMLQYKNGKYELYSSEGYDMLFDERQ